MKIRFLAVLLILSCLFVGSDKNYACINDPPNVSITYPYNGTIFAEGDNVLINASASDSDGYVTKVEFYQGTTKLGEDTSGPSYSHIWYDIQASPAGTYSLTAKAFDNDGAITTSAPPVNITVTDVWYVDAGAMNVDGQTWGWAFNSLQDALHYAKSGDEIRVAEGIYKPDRADRGAQVTLGDRGATFQLKNGVTIYGGFAGYTPGGGWGSPPQPPAPDPDTRDIELYLTVLSGDLSGDDNGFTNNSENSYHVVTGEDNTILDGFTISGGNADGSQPDNYGGGIYCASKSPTISNCTITNNNASSQGGGFYCSNASPTISNCTFANNNTDSQGGGFYCSNASATISNCSIKDNIGVDGGGMFNSNSGASLILTNCTFSGNESTNSSADGGGGGIHNSSSSPTVENCTFSENEAAYMGGGIYNYNSSTKITNCVFSGNKFTEGTSAGGGGGIYNDSSSPTVENCILSENEAVSFGGGIYSINSSPTITNCFFSGNTAEKGGGMNNDQQVSTPTLTNCTFNGNSAVQNGGGIYNGNNSTPTLTNCILWANDAPSGSQIYNEGTSSATISYSDIEGCGGSPPEEGPWNSDFGIDGGKNIDQNPEFVNPDSFYLGLDSPCINAGDPAGSYDGQTDIGGEPRVLCLRVDMGADEVAKTIHVDVAQDPGGDGLSWGVRAHKDLQHVLTTAAAGEEIWVANGIYELTNPTGRTASFNLKPGMLIYGGFNGDETSINERNLFDDATESILSGDIGDPGVADNSYHVVVGADGAVLDGFTIKGGNADGSGETTVGGGMYNNSCSPTVANCIFRNNNAHYYGGGMYNFVASPMVVNCFFSGNTAGACGGGISGQPPWVWGPPPPPGDPHYYPAGSTTPSNPTLINCTFSGNSAVLGGGMSRGHNSAIVNCIFWGNTPSEPYLTSNVSISYSDIEDCGGSPPEEGPWNSDFGIDGGKNIKDDPLFVDADGPDEIPGTDDDDLSLQPGSPCIDKGINDENMGANWQIDATIIDDPVAVINPVDLAIGSNGNIYVLSSSENSSQVLIYNDQLVQQGNPINVDEAENPEGIALDGDNNIFIADTNNHRILKYDSFGDLDDAFDDDGMVGEYGSLEGQFDKPWGIAVNWSGYVYVTDSGNDRVQIFEPDGQFDSEWGELGSGDGQLDNPTGFCLFGSSEIYLADTGNDRIQNLSAKTGHYYGGIGEPGTNLQDACYDLQFDQLIVADKVNNRIQIFQLNNFGETSSSEITYIDQIVEITDLSPTTISGPMGVACKSSDTKQILYIADTSNNRIIKVEVEKERPGRSPLHVWEIFKAALWSGDVDRALTYFGEASKERYAEIFQLLEPHLQDYIAGMGEMTLESRQAGKVKYEMLHQDGPQTLSFPVFLIKDEDDNWKIFNF